MDEQLRSKFISEHTAVPNLSNGEANPAGDATMARSDQFRPDMFEAFKERLGRSVIFEDVAPVVLAAENASEVHLRNPLIERPGTAAGLI